MSETLGLIECMAQERANPRAIKQVMVQKA